MCRFCMPVCVCGQACSYMHVCLYIIVVVGDYSGIQLTGKTESPIKVYFNMQGRRATVGDASRPPGCVMARA